MFQTAENPTDIWKHINVLLRKTKPKSTMAKKIIVGNETIVSLQNIRVEINNHFVKIDEKLSASLENNLHDKHYIKYLGKRNVSSILLRSTDERKIIEIIGKINNNKSMGFIDSSIVLF